MTCCSACDPEHDGYATFVHVTIERDASGELNAVAWGERRVSPEQLRADVEWLERFVLENPPHRIDDVVYRSRPS